MGHGAWGCGRRPALRRCTLVELKCCSDTQWQPALLTARAQHQALMRDIESAHRGCEVNCVVVLLGAAGSIYKEHTQEALRQLGLSHQQVQQLTRKMHERAVHRAHDLVVARRRQAAGQPRDAG